MLDGRWQTRSNDRLQNRLDRDIHREGKRRKKEGRREGRRKRNSLCVCVWVTRSCLSLWTPWTAAHQVFCPCDSPGKNPGVGCPFLYPGFPSKEDLNEFLCSWIFVGGGLRNLGKECKELWIKGAHPPLSTEVCIPRFVGISPSGGAFTVDPKHHRASGAEPLCSRETARELSQPLHPQFLPVSDLLHLCFQPTGHV